MTKYSIHYERKVQIRPYEMLTIGLTQEFDEYETEWREASLAVRNKVEEMVLSEQRRLGAS